MTLVIVFVVLSIDTVVSHQFLKLKARPPQSLIPGHQDLIRGFDVQKSLSQAMYFKALNSDEQDASHFIIHCFLIKEAFCWRIRVELQHSLYFVLLGIIASKFQACEVQKSLCFCKCSV